MRIDWSIGHYEETASELAPAAELLVDEAEPLPGKRVVDVGCGTGNAALLAAVRGARVIGVDPALRLLDVARERAEAGALDVAFLAGEAAAIPVGDKSADVVLSVFGVIFAPDAEAAAAELARVTADDGRIMLTAWIPDGAVSRMNKAHRKPCCEPSAHPRGHHPFPGTTPKRSTSSLPHMASRSLSRNTASLSMLPRHMTSSKKDPAILSLSPVAKSSNVMASRRTSTCRCLRSSKRRTKIQAASGSLAATSRRQV